MNLDYGHPECEGLNLYDMAVDYGHSESKGDREKAYGMAITLNDCAIKCRAESKYDEALRIFLLILKTFINLRGINHDHTTEAFKHIGVTFKFQGRLDLARETFEKLWNAWKGYPNSVAVDAAVHLSQVLCLEGRRLDALAVLDDARLRATETFGREDPATIDVLHAWGKMLREQGDDEAATVLKDALNTATTVLGSEHRLTIHCKLSLMIAYTYQGNLGEETRVGLEDTLSLAKQVWGKDCIDTKLAQKWYGFYFLCVGNFIKAKEIYEHLLSWGRTQERTHPVFIFHIMHSLADTHLEQKQHEDAEKLYREALAGRQKFLGQNHPDTLSSMYGLSKSLWHNGKQDEANTLCQETCVFRKKVLGPSHPRTTQAELLQKQIDG